MMSGGKYSLIRKKYILLSIALSIILIVSRLFTAYALGNATVYADSIRANAGQTVRIPIMIKNNSGLAGTKFIFKYDYSVLTPISVEAGDAFTSGIQDNIDGDAQPGQFNVYWASPTGDNNSSNGILFYINFNVSSSAYGDTKLEISYNQADTFNEDFDDVPIDCKNVSIQICNDKIDGLSKITSTASLKSDKYVDLKLHITNADKLNNSILKIEYDENTFSYNSIAGNANLVSDNVGIMKINVFASSSDENSDFVTVRFTLSNSCKSGEYPFNISSDNQDLLCEGCKIELVTLPDSDSAEIYIPKGIVAENGKRISIPVLINYNQGIMGYRLSFSYDASRLKIVSVANGEKFKANITDSIGNKAGAFDVVWCATSNNTNNGVLLYLNFEVISIDNAKIDTQIGIGYSRCDTINENYDEIELNCNYGEISICPGHTYISSIIKPECEAQGYTAYICKYCNISYYDSYTQPLGHYYVYQKQAGSSLPQSKAINYKCKYCEKTYNTSGDELLDLWSCDTKYINSEPDRSDLYSQLFDVNYDKVINAKDYAMIYHSHKLQ